MPAKIPQIQIYIISILDILSIIFASYLTMQMTAVDILAMTIFTSVVTFYWFLAVIITGLYRGIPDFKKLLLKIAVSLIIIMAVSAVQQLIFLNIPFYASSIFFAISLVLLVLVNVLFFKSKK